MKAFVTARYFDVCCVSCFNVFMIYYFRPVSREIFLDILKNATFYTQFLIAPFGLPIGSSDCYGGESKAFEEFNATYHQWEELVSRVLYKSRNIPGTTIMSSYYFHFFCLMTEFVFRCLL